MVGNFTLHSAKTLSNKTYDSVSSRTRFRIEADLPGKNTTLIVDHARRKDSRVYVCCISIIKPLAMQWDLYGNGTVVNVQEAKVPSSPIVYVVLSVLLPVLCLTVYIMRRVPQGNVLKTVPTSSISGQELGTNQHNKGPQPFTIYSSLRLSLMRSPERQQDGGRQLTVYATVHRPASNVAQSTVSHALELKQAGATSDTQHSLWQ
ncbi:uncharacterized protein [Heterodontus francisci]|uniref:uncharacterized protein n=1 Tax=Heterodontus francisci TaxID=7792 RepID=UPI00355AF8A6